jgi:hypothetical protein
MVRHGERQNQIKSPILMIISSKTFLGKTHFERPPNPDF